VAPFVGYPTRPCRKALYRPPSHSFEARQNLVRLTLISSGMQASLSQCALLAAMAISAWWTSVTWAQPASIGPTAAAAQEQFICRLPGASDRLVGIYRPLGGPQSCRVDYTRDGKTRSLWSSGRDYKFCVRKALEIVGLLEGVNFKCSPHSAQATDSATSRPHEP
jgi:hypothetical protein